MYTSISAQIGIEAKKGLKTWRNQQIDSRVKSAATKKLDRFAFEKAAFETFKDSRRTKTKTLVSSFNKKGLKSQGFCVNNLPKQIKPVIVTTKLQSLHWQHCVSSIAGVDSGCQGSRILCSPIYWSIYSQSICKRFKICLDESFIERLSINRNLNGYVFFNQEPQVSRERDDQWTLLGWPDTCGAS